MKTCFSGALLALSAACVFAEVRVSVREEGGRAAIQYQCTAGEIIRAFALDVSLDRGRFTGVTNFFRGISKAGDTGYGIFPASIRNSLTGTNVDWTVPAYTPLADPADAPEDTLPGLDTPGVTLEFGALWNPAVPESVPAAAGTLCVLHLSGPARVAIAPNRARGGVIPADAASVTTVFTGAIVGPAITGFSIADGLMRIAFRGGELQTAATVDGSWTSTGNTSGEHSESIGPERARFFRVRAGTDP